MPQPSAVRKERLCDAATALEPQTDPLSIMAADVDNVHFPNGSQRTSLSQPTTATIQIQEPAKEPRELDTSDVRSTHERFTLYHLLGCVHRWISVMFPTATSVSPSLPFFMLPFILTISILIQALVNTSWIAALAYGWDHWTTKTGTVGAIGGIGFILIILSNVSIPNQTPLVAFANLR